MTPAVAQAVRDSFARQTLMETLGATLVRVEAGICEIAAPIARHVLQQHGHGHAGLTFALGDSAAGYAALTLLPEGAEVMTVEMKINLLRPAAGTRLTAEGRVMKAGRRLSVVQATVRADGKDVAVLQGTMIPLLPE